MKIVRPTIWRNKIDAMRLIWARRGQSLSDGTEDYNSRDWHRDEVTPITCSVTDAPLNFFIRIMLEKRYARVIEIGTGNGARIVALKRLFPDVEMFGVDVGMDTETALCGVRLAPFWRMQELAFPDSLVISHGTFAYIDNPIITLANIRGDLSLCEPIAPNQIGKSRRRSHISYFHPYERLLTESGFANVNASKRLGVPLMGEPWLFAYASHSESSNSITRGLASRPLLHPVT